MENKQELKFEYGQRAVVNGVERAYHGYFSSRGYHDFVRPVEKGFEYSSFIDMAANENGEFNGKEVPHRTRVYEASSGFDRFSESSNLHFRAKNIWKMGERKQEDAVA